MSVDFYSATYVLWARIAIFVANFAHGILC